MQTNLLVGLGAGLVSAVLFASASTGTILGLFVLFFLSPLPVAIAGLGWGWRAAAIAAVAGALVIGIIGNTRGVVFHAAAIGLPTVILSHYCLLNREVRPDTGAAVVEWYPLGRILALAGLIAGALAALGLVTTAPDMAALKTLLSTALERMITLPAEVKRPAGMPDKLTPEQLASLTGLMTGIFTVSLATMWLAVATFNLWLAAHVVARSGRLVRPWPDLSQVRLPGWVPIALAATLAGTYAADFPGLIAAGFAGALLFAYVIVGLAIVHNLTRGSSVRPMILSVVYAALVLLGMIAAPLLALLALAEPLSPLRRPPPSGNTST
jgi:hypothetical protein